MLEPAISTGDPMQTADLVALPLAQRLQAMEALWESLCKDSDQAQIVPTWHQEVLGQRLESLNAGIEIVSPWEEAKDRIRQRSRQAT